MNDPAQACLEAARTGDVEAAGRIVDLFHAPLYAFLRRLAGSESDAVELTQRSFCRAWRSLPSFSGRCTISSWLHSIAYRTYVDWLRAERRSVSQPDSWWQAVGDPAPSPDRLASAGDDRATVYAAVDALEPALRETIHLHYYQGLSIEETAAALGIATSTVKYRMRQALTELQRAVVTPPASLDSPAAPQIP